MTLRPHTEPMEDRERLGDDSVANARYSNLPVETRKWIESRRKEDWDKLDRAIETSEKLAVATKMTRWMAIFIAGAFALGASIMVMLNGIKSWRG